VLNADPEAPWAALAPGGLTGKRLGDMLSDFEIRPVPEAIRFEVGRARGYAREAFADAWRRYCPPVPPGVSGKIVTDRAYLKVFHEARAAAFSEVEAASLIARRPYDLRHAAVSTWLNAGVTPAQVAEWAGHTVDVLLRVYAKCVAGQQDEAKRRILEATTLKRLGGEL